MPLIDVLVMLVFFTFATMQFRDQAGGTLNLTLPRAETAGKNVFQSQVVISIDKESKMRVTIQDRDGRMVLDKMHVSSDQLGELAADLRDVDKDITVLIRQDKSSPVELLIHAMDVCRKNGLNKIRFQTQ